MFRALTFVAVRQEQAEAAQTRPLGFAAGDELIDHHLRTVDKITELRLPDHQLKRLRGGVTVLEPEHRFLRQQRIDDDKIGLLAIDVLQRNIGAGIPFFAVLVVHHRVAVREGAAPAILPAHAHRMAGRDQRRVREIFRHAPIERQFAAAHFAARFQQFFHRHVAFEIGRNLREAFGVMFQRIERHSRVGNRAPALANIRCPIDRQRRLDAIKNFGVGAFARIEPRANVSHQIVTVPGGGGCVGGETVRIEFSRAWMLGDLFVHQRLRDERLILLVVAEFAKANHIDYHVLAKFHPVIERDATHHQHRFRIVRIHMKHRGLDHLGDIGAIQGRARIARVGSGEPDLIVDDDMHRAAGLEAARLRERHGFHHHALPGKCGVAVNQHRQHFLAFVIAAPVLACAHRPFDHRIDDFQMRRVERERQMHTAALGLNIG